MSEGEHKGDTPATGAEQSAPKPEPKDAKPSAPKGSGKYVMAERQSRTSKRGILTAGDEVKPEDLGGGKESFDHLVKQGVIVKES